MGATLVAKGPRSADYFLGNMFPDKTPGEGRSVVIMPDSATTFVHYEGWMLNSYSGGDVTLKVPWFSLSVSTGAIRLEGSVEHNAPDGNPMNAANFGTVKAVTSTVSGVFSALKYAEITLTNADMQTIAGSRAFRLKISRVPSHAGDTLVGNALMLLWAMEEA